MGAFERFWGVYGWLTSGMRAVWWFMGGYTGLRYGMV
tara:strand:- start:2432 stop:2542 length:111 start_codon:yes stop_codon:yes gene_type:complete